jgi:hypothetical protein
MSKTGGEPAADGDKKYVVRNIEMFIEDLWVNFG